MTAAERMSAALVRTSYAKDAWADPWGKASEGYVVHEIISDLWESDLTIKRHDGYELRVDKVWESTDGYRRFQEMRNYIDFSGGCGWREIGDDDENLTYIPSVAGVWERPSPSKRYALAGVPVILSVPS